MKKIFKMLFYSLCLCIMNVGCESPIDEEPQPEPQPEPTKYEVYVDIDLEQFNSSGIDTDLKVVCFEYNDQNEMVDTQTWYNVFDGQSRTFIANKRSTKIVVKLELTGSHGSTT